MKNILTALLIVLTAISLFFFSACSPDIVEEETAEETLLTPEPEPKPDWIDGVLTVEVGEYKTGPEMLNELRRQQVRLGIMIADGLLDPKFPISGKQYTIEVEVVTMFEVGLNEPTSYEDIYSRYLERGYRPLTPEEAITLRLQFKDQPSMASGQRLARFLVLMDPSVVASYRHHSNGYYSMSCMRGSRGLGTVPRSLLLDPINGVRIMRTYPPGTMPDTRFAVVKR